MVRCTLLCLAVFGLILAIPTTPISADEEGNKLKALMEQKTSSIVTVKAIVRRDMPPMLGGSSEATSEVQGVVVDKTGLIMLSNQPFADQSFGSGPMGMSITVTPLSFKVIFENEEREYAAFLATKDEDLNLAFVQIEELGGRELNPVDFGKAVKADIGQKVVAVSRMGRGYDYAPYFATGRIAGMIKKPRKAMVVDGMMGAMGLPVFLPSGEVVGVITTVSSGVEDEGDGMDLMAIFSQIAGTPFVVPGKMVRARIAQAIPEAQRLLEEKRAGEKGDGGKEEEL